MFELLYNIQRTQSKVILDSTFAQIRKHFVQVSERLAKTMEMSLFANVHQDLRETRMCPAGLFSIIFCRFFAFFCLLLGASHYLLKFCKFAMQTRE
jgi:hypothetical protein